MFSESVSKMCSNLILIVAVICGVPGVAYTFQQQYFRVSPRNARVHAGGEAVLQCAVGNLAGQVQWAKDGFALGYSSIIPGYPRHTMFGERRAGVYNLRIVNVTLADEGEYQCQVGPANLHKVIRANASLTVVAPPTSVEMTGHPHGSKLEVKEGAEVTLECLVRNAKPPASVVWYKGSVQLKGDIVSKEEVKPVESSTGNPKMTKYNTISRIALKASPEDDYADFTCEARHEATPRDAPLRASVQFSVLYPPGAPYIEGYSEGAPVRAGQTVSLACRSRGGNPPAQLVWYRNQEQVRMAYRTAGRMSENVLSFVATSADNKARYSCEAKNVMITETLRAHVDLTVLFAPSHVSISGSTEARVGDSVLLTCATSPSNPPADVKWVVGGRQQRADGNETVVAPEGGWITRSNITVSIEASRRSVVSVCHGINSRLADSVVATHTVNVFYPPSAPMITGYTPGSALAAGDALRLLCVSSGGNPAPQLVWYKNDKKIPSTSRNMEQSVAVELSLVADVSDNLAQYRCEATNSATDIPLRESVVLNVHFPPETVRVSWPGPVSVSAVSGVSGVSGVSATRLRCDSSSSHPAATLSWWRDGIPVQGEPMTMKKGLHGGTVSSIELSLNITKELNGAVYTCQAMNEALQRSVHDALTLKVLYPPVFDSSPDSVECIQNGSVSLSATARGEPDDVTYTWTRDGQPLSDTDGITISKSELSISSVQIGSAGVYTVEATNSQGSSHKNITLHVLYAAKIKSVSQIGNIARHNEDAILTCTADGNPLKADHFRWERPDTVIDPSHVTYDPLTHTSTLTHTPTRSDVGNWTCVVDNTLGVDKREVLLVVPFKPEMDLAPALAKAAANVGQTVRLTCSCLSAPAPAFTWSRGGAPLPPSHRYAPSPSPSPSPSPASPPSPTSARALRHTGTLLIRDVTSADYGTYECTATNTEGESKMTVELVMSGPPEMVTSLWIINVTSSSVLLGWSPGFDGGAVPTYRIRYRKQSSEAYTYVDTSRDVTQHSVTGLSADTDYVFSIMCVTSRGQSRYRPDDVTATTLSSPLGAPLPGGPPAAPEPQGGGSAVLYVSISGALLVALNAALIACFLLRRRTNRLKEVSHGSSSKSGAIEMYAPSSYSPGAESLSARSERSDSRCEAPPLPDMPQRMLSTDGYLLGDGLLPPPLEYPSYPAGGGGGGEYPSYPAGGGGGGEYPAYPVGGGGGGGGGEYPEYPPDYSDAYSPREVHSRTLPRHKPPPAAPAPAPAPAPSPRPPPDGSYYNMAAERYLSYPPPMPDYLPQSTLSISAGGYATVRRDDDMTHGYDVDGHSLHGTLRRHNKLSAPPRPPPPPPPAPPPPPPHRATAGLLLAAPAAPAARCY